MIKREELTQVHLYSLPVCLRNSNLFCNFFVWLVPFLVKNSSFSIAISGYKHLRVGWLLHHIGSTKMYCQCISFFIYILISEHVYFTFLRRKFVSLLTTIKLLSSTMCEYCSIIERFFVGTIIFVFLWVLATANNELSPRDFHWMRFWELWSWQLLQQRQWFCFCFSGCR